MSAVILGIDPGLTGAISALSENGEYEFVSDLPVITDRSLSWIDGDQLRTTLLHYARGRDVIACIERVSAMPKQGVASSFNFGVGFGSVLGVLQAMQCRIEFVTPATWKRALGLSSDKHASLHKARLLFPFADLRLKKHDGRAEALLIAHWFHNTHRQKAAA